jgi:DNA-binding transcriptional ArsR family regulator
MVEYDSRTDTVFRALADPTRRAIVERLAQGESTVGELAAPFAMSLAGASKHLGVLEEAGLVVRKKQGRERICSLRPDGLFALRDWVERYSRFWEARLDALEAVLKEEDDG